MSERIEVILGKIESVSFGFIPDTPLFGLELKFSLDGGASQVSTGGAMAFNAADYTKYCKWTIEDQRIAAISTLREMIQYMKDAKITEINKFIGIPVEVCLTNNRFTSFRILTEVL